MRTYSRRTVMHTGMVSLGALSGLYGIVDASVAAIGVDAFSAPDQSIVTRDGSVSGIIINPNVSITWEGMTQGYVCDVVLRVGNVDASETATLATRSITFDTTAGSTDIDFSAYDLLATDEFDSTDFVVESPGAQSETSVSFGLDIDVNAGSNLIISESAETSTTLTVKRLPKPSIEVFTIHDSSNPAHTRCTVSWEVSDDATELASVASALQFESDDEPSATDATSVSGDNASGEHEYEINEIDPDGYALTLTVTNEEGITRTETLAEEEGYDYPDAISFETLTATITETELHGQNEKPTAAMIEYTTESDELVELTATMTVNDDAASASDTGSQGTISVNLDSSGGSTDIATITVSGAAIPTYETDLRAADGTISLLE